VLLFGFAAGMMLAQTEGNEIKNLQIRKLEDKLVVLVESERSVIYDSFILNNPNRLVLDFMNIEKISLQPEYDVSSFGIARIRTGKNRPSVCRIVFDIAQEFPQYRIDEVEKGLEISFWPEVREMEQKVQETKPVEETVTQKKPEDVPRKVEKKPAEEKPMVTPRLERLGTEQQEDKKFTIGIVSGLYLVQDEVFREVYGSSMMFFGAEYSLALPVESMDVWFGFNYMRDKGKTTFLEEDLTLKMMHFSLAVRYVFKVNILAPFLGAGVDYITYQENYPEGFPFTSIDGSTLGFHIQGGSYFRITDALAAKLLLKYNFAKETRDDLEIQLGGLQLGVGLIYRFNF
jgi:hypothetical protein